jgi:hypothetical protein
MPLGADVRIARHDGVITVAAADIAIDFEFDDPSICSSFFEKINASTGLRPPTPPRPTAPPPLPIATRPPHEPERVGVGLTLKLSRDKRIIIADVNPNGPAAECGVAVDDEIVAIDGRPYPPTMHDRILDAMMGPSGSSVELELRRGKERRFVRVARRPIATPVTPRGKAVSPYAMRGGDVKAPLVSPPTSPRNSVSPYARVGLWDSKSDVDAEAKRREELSLREAEAQAAERLRLEEAAAAEAKRRDEEADLAHRDLRRLEEAKRMEENAEAKRREETQREQRGAVEAKGRGSEAEVLALVQHEEEGIQSADAAPSQAAESKRSGGAESNADRSRSASPSPAEIQPAAAASGEDLVARLLAESRARIQNQGNQDAVHLPPPPQSPPLSSASPVASGAEGASGSARPPSFALLSNVAASSSDVIAMVVSLTSLGVRHVR